MGRWEVSDAPGCCWHPEPPLDEEGRRAEDCCGDELWHLQINSGNLKTSLGVVDFWAESGLGELRQTFLSLCLCCVSNSEEGMGEALCCAEDCPDPW